MKLLLRQCHKKPSINWANSQATTSENGQQHFKRIMQSKQRVWDNVELELVRKDGSHIPVLIHGKGIYDKNDQLVATRTIVRDISELKEAEIKLEQERGKAKIKEIEYQDRLARAERMESLGVLASGIAHDLNNLMGPLVGMPDIILEELDAVGVPEDHRVRSDILTMKQSAAQAVTVIQDLLVLSRHGSYEQVPLDLNATIRSYLGTANYKDLLEQHQNVTVEINLDPELPATNGSDAHLARVVMNLVMNACEAMMQGGMLSLKTAHVILDQPLEAYETIAAGSYSVLRVRDSGSGIDADSLNRIFEPFFTKKRFERSGSGLGLAVVYGVVKDHAGFIDVSTEVGQGTMFSLYLPTTMEPIAAADSGMIKSDASESALIV